MRSIFLLFTLILSNPTPAQKKTIDTSILNNWPTIGQAAINNDGSYIMYDINNYLPREKALIFQSTNAKWEKTINGVDQYGAKFSDDNRFGIFLKKDTLYLLKLGTNILEKIPDVTEYKIHDFGNSSWLSYKTQSGTRLTIHQLSNTKKVFFQEIINYEIAKNILYLLKYNKKHEQVLECINLVSGKTHTISLPYHIERMLTDTSGKGISFIIPFSKIRNETERALGYYKLGMNEILLLRNNDIKGIDKTLDIDNIDYFNLDENKIYVTLKERSYRQLTPANVSVDIWSYFDTKLQSEQLAEKAALKSYKAVVNIEEKRMIRIEQPNERIIFNTSNTSQDNKLYFIQKTEGDVGRTENFWNKSGLFSYYLLNADNGQKTPIIEKTRIWKIGISPKKDFVVYFDPEKKHYFSHNTQSNKTYDITKDIQTTWTPFTDGDSVYSKLPLNFHYTIAGWSSDSSSVILADQNDLWLVHLSGERAPVNITNSYGRKNKIVFRFLNHLPGSILNLDEKIILSAFNRENKNNGFYLLQLKKHQDPKKLRMDAYMYYAPENPNSKGMQPIKAKQKNIYIVKRMSALHSPNFYVTHNFKDFTQLSNIEPEKSYTWLSTELINWRALDGIKCQGVLYKPENFDSTRKYPLILHYYEKKSHLLNEYIKPSTCDGDINIPWFVSQGYIVFTPDMHNQLGKYQTSIINVIVSAVNYLKKRTWVDSTKLGIQGFSFGGYETNILITHTNLFAAAVSGAGPTDLVSFHGSLFEKGNGNSRQDAIENGQIGIDAAPWEDPERYIRNSPIFHVHKVTTPLLLMNNKNDGAVDFYQAIEFFTALRRLGKKVWMLQYDNGSHGVWNDDAMDYTLRMTQFFDHYLKGQPAPKWMLYGIPAKLKGLDMGLELDTPGKTPGTSPLLLKN